MNLKKFVTCLLVLFCMENVFSMGDGGYDPGGGGGNPVWIPQSNANVITVENLSNPIVLEEKEYVISGTVLLGSDYCNRNISLGIKVLNSVGWEKISLIPSSPFDSYTKLYTWSYKVDHKSLVVNSSTTISGYNPDSLNNGQYVKCTKETYYGNIKTEFALFDENSIILPDYKTTKLVYNNVLKIIPSPAKFNVVSGIFSINNVSVSLGTGNGLKIYYTTNGTDPLKENGVLYGTPFNVSQNTIVKAVALYECSANTDKVYSSVNSVDLKIDLTQNFSWYLYGDGIYSTKNVYINGDLKLTGNLYKNGVLIANSSWLMNGNNVYYNAEGNIGIGTDTPTEKLSVNGTILTNRILVKTGWAAVHFASG